jgi:hypothetical protein
LVRGTKGKWKRRRRGETREIGERTRENDEDEEKETGVGLTQWA